MNFPTFRNLALILFASLSTTASAESHVDQAEDGAVKYGSDECNNDPDYLNENGILCAAVFSDVSVGDYLNTLSPRISLSMLAELNPRIENVDRNTVIGGITILRVR